jgi:hypothetical protein
MTETTVMAWLTLFPASEAEIEVTNGFTMSKNPYKNYKKIKQKYFSGWESNRQVLTTLTVA